MSDRHRIVVVGGGAGGLELVTRLGDSLGRKGKAEIVLVDCGRVHVWKPLLHEVAAGTLDTAEEALEYLAQGHRHHFRFIQGTLDGLDREGQRIHLSALHEDGEEILPERWVAYDTLVLAVGSVSNDFATPGVAEHCFFLDGTDQAERLQRQLLNAMLRAQARGGPCCPGELDAVIVGGGATGVELAAQLHQVTRRLSSYGLDHIEPDRHIHLHLIESGERILGPLPQRVAETVEQELRTLGVSIHTNERVTEVTADGVHTARGEFIPARLKVWAAGIKAPDVLAGLGLEVNRRNQLVVHRTLQTTRDEAIFAMGDCAACPTAEGDGLVPARAQAAHQEASFLARALRRRLAGGPIPAYRYKDWGSLVSLGRYSTVGNIMGQRIGSHTVSGVFARAVYLGLHESHQAALYGWPRALMLSTAHLMRRRIHPQIKLH